MLAFVKKSIYDRQYGIMAACVFICCLLLFYMDKDVKSFHYLLNWKIFIVLLIYFIPTYFIVFLFFRLVVKFWDKDVSVILSLFIGVPAGFTLVIYLLSR